jgi:AraC-like DNA-binding protein
LQERFEKLISSDAQSAAAQPDPAIVDARLQAPRCAQYVLARRLDAARKMLEQPSYASMTIAEIGARCGFRSNAYFSSTFTVRFGQRPSDARRLAPH